MLCSPGSRWGWRWPCASATPPPSAVTAKNIGNICNPGKKFISHEKVPVQSLKEKLNNLLNIVNTIQALTFLSSAEQAVWRANRPKANLLLTSSPSCSLSSTSCNITRCQRQCACGGFGTTRLQQRRSAWEKNSTLKSYPKAKTNRNAAKPSVTTQSMNEKDTIPAPPRQTFVDTKNVTKINFCIKKIRRMKKKRMQSRKCNLL